MAGILKVDTIQNANADNIITQTNSTTLTIGASGDTVTLAAGATSSGFGATYNGAVNWDTTAKTTTVTAASGVGYFINTTAGAITVNLPAGVAGSIVSLSDYAGTWQTNNVTVNANGSEKIGGAAAPATLNTKGQAVTFVYVDSTRGWINTGDATFIEGAAYVAATGGTITTCGNYKIHSFTGPGTFTVTNAGGPTGSNSVDYLVVAGGGGGAPCTANGGGGGAGGFRESVPSPAAWTASPLANPGGALPVSVQGYPITVGAGGTVNPAGVAGGNSVFSTITSAGGGGARAYNQSGLSGGSGSGSGGHTGGGPYAGGAGNTPPTSPPQGNPGGSGAQFPTYDAGGGGGGAGGAGSNSTGPIGTGGAGGAGVSTSISSSPITYSNGGLGGGSTTYPLSPTYNPANSVNRTANQAGGGNVAFNGGSGVVVIRYKFQ
jgi:hypothetical protein